MTAAESLSWALTYGGAHRVITTTTRLDHLEHNVRRFLIHEHALNDLARRWIFWNEGWGYFGGIDQLYVDLNDKGPINKIFHYF